MDKRTAAYALEQIASFMELKGENTFRVRAFVTAARVLRALPGELEPALAVELHHGCRADRAPER